MLNYMNIDEIEFEEICKQILEKRTGKTYRVFGRGPDGGIDIQANENSKIIGQVKFYLNTPQSQVVNNIKKEINRIKNKDVEQYYIFIGREMSPQSIEEIYQEGKEILKTKLNIFTLKEIDELLNTEKYSEIVRKHIKLWLAQTSILEQINNKSIFIDCEILLDDIKEDVKLFVQTELYETCKKILDKDRLLLILGMPGIGKTMTSKMLVLHYANEGYRIRYSNSRNIEKLKESLDLTKNEKELIFLDDCLGQRYLELSEQKENDIINLVKYIRNNPNKMLLLNSRVTIFQEAKNKHHEIGKYVDNKNLQIQVLNVENISDLEKARILKHYLFVKKIPREYIQQIVKDNNYLNIIENDSYNPRILDYMTEKTRYTNINPQDYAQAIEEAFIKSKFVWKDEYENKIELQDRIFLITLFSMSDYSVKEDILKRAFYKRLEAENMDTSIPIYERVLERLNQSFVKIRIKNNGRFISVINPSVNDFLREELRGNTIEKEKILKSAIAIDQIKRAADTQKEYDEFVMKKINRNEFLNYISIEDGPIEELYVVHLFYYNMLEKMDRIDLMDTIFSLRYQYSVYELPVFFRDIFWYLWNNHEKTKNLNEKVFFDGQNLSKLLYKDVLEGQIELLQNIYREIEMENKSMKNEKELIQYLKREFADELNLYSMDLLAQRCRLDDIVANEIEELKASDQYESKLSKLPDEKFKRILIEKVRKQFQKICINYIQDKIDHLHCELPDILYNAVKCPEIGVSSFKTNEMYEVVLKYINYVYNTRDEDYSYYKKYIYDGHLLNKQEETDSKKAIKELFQNL